MSGENDSQPSLALRAVGMVEVMTGETAAGWIAGEPEEFPIRVELCLNNLVVMTTWANYPCELNTHGGAKGFSFAIKDLWAYVGKADYVTVRVSGEPLPIHRKGAFESQDADGDFTAEDLRGKLAAGFIFDRTGRLRLSKKLDTQWQSQVVSLFDRVADVVKAAAGYDIFIFYGSLLGQVREGGFIGHDDGFDAAYVSDCSDGAAAATELRDLAFTLIDAGLDVECGRAGLRIHDPAAAGVTVDLFHTFFDHDDRLALPFGRAGDTEFGRDEWQGASEAEMAGHTVVVPVAAEQLVAHLYGEDWRVPQVGFSWNEAVTQRDSTGITSASHREAVYWANFYSRHAFTSGSTFFDKINARTDVPTTVLDIGSGDGRDSFAFAKAGRRTFGVDRSSVGVEQATRKAEQEALGDLLSFATCDVSDLASLRAIIGRSRDQALGGPVLFYMRFFLHSIPEDVQHGLMDTIAEQAQRGDVLAAEFRTDKDESKRKTYGKHYRRFQNGPEFGRLVGQRYGFVVLEQQQGTGLSVYKDEDPDLYRVVARKGDSAGTG